MRRSRDLAYVAVAACFALGLGWLALVRTVEPLALDQGLFACFARFVPRGLLPYRDLFDSKPPLFLYLHVLAGRFGAEPATALWRFETLWLAATAAVAFVLARRWGRWAGLGAAALVWLALWSPSWGGPAGGYWSRAQAEELLAMPMMGAIAAALAARRDARAALVAGVLTGVVGLIKVPGMAVGAACLCAWYESGLVKRAALMIAGLVAPWALAFLWFGLHHGAGAFWESVFVYQGHWAAFIAPPWSHVVGKFARTLIVETPGLLALAVTGVVASWRRDRAEALCLGVWIVATAIAVMLQRQLAEYHYLLVVPPLAIAAARALAWLSEVALSSSGARQLAAGAALLTASVLGIREAAGWVSHYRLDATFRAGAVSRAMYLRSFGRGGGFSPEIEAQAAAFLRDHTRPEQSILVWGLSPGIYALADRMPATRFPFHQLLLTESPFSLAYPGLDARRAEFLARLRRDPPAYVLVGTRDANGFEPDDSYTEMLRFPAFRSLIESDYVRETELGAFLVYRRR